MVSVLFLVKIEMTVYRLLHALRIISFNPKTTGVLQCGSLLYNSFITEICVGMVVGGLSGVQLYLVALESFKEL